MGILKALIFSSVISLSSCSSLQEFSNESAKDYMTNLKKEYDYYEVRGNFQNIRKANEILTNYPNIEDYFSDKSKDEYNEFIENVEAEVNKISGRAVDPTLCKYPIYKKIKNMFRIKFSYGYSMAGDRGLDSDLEDLNSPYEGYSWPFVSKNFKIKGGAKFSTKLNECLDESLSNAINPEVYLILMDMYTSSWYPTRKELKQNLKLRYWKIEGNLYHKIEEDFGAQKLGIGLHYFFNKDCNLTFNWEEYLKIGKSELDDKKMWLELVIKF